METSHRITKLAGATIVGGLCCLTFSTGILRLNAVLAEQKPQANAAPKVSLVQSPKVNAAANKPANKSVPAGSAEMQAANAAAAKLVTERMRRERPADYNLLKAVRQSEIVVVRGEYDHVETVLSAVTVPHLAVEPQDLDHIELNAGQLLLINCPGELSDKAIAKVRKFVYAGGFLFTTDWALQNVLEKAFGRIVRYNRKPTEDDVVAVRILKRDNMFLQHVSTTKDNPKWWLEGQSYPIQIIDKKRVEVLIESDEMKRKYKDAPIAINFKYGDGRVLHIVSHFYLQRTETRTKEEKSAGGNFKANVAMPAYKGADAELAKTTAGAVRDAYASQQMSTNIIVAKRQQNRELQKIYSYATRSVVVLRAAPNGSSKQVGSVKAGTQLKLLGRQGAWLRVQTYSGDTGWLEEKNVTKR